MPKKQSKNYKTKFLTNVIFKADFPKILDLEKNPPINFQKKIQKAFPHLNEIKADFVELKTDKGGLKSLYHAKAERPIIWEFLNKKKTKKVVLDRRAPLLVIEYKEYTNFEEFLKDLKLVFESFFKIYGVQIAKNVGMRHIYQIKLNSGDPLNWKGLLNQDLLSVTAFPTKKDKVIRSMHVLELKENTHNLLFQFGLYNSEYPNPITRKEFALDYYCFTKEDIEAPDIFKKAREFNNVIESWFKNSILSGLKR